MQNFWKDWLGVLWFNWVKLRFGIASSHRSECLWWSTFTILNWNLEVKLQNRETCWCKIPFHRTKAPVVVMELQSDSWLPVSVPDECMDILRKKISIYIYYMYIFDIPYHISISIFPTHNTWVITKRWQDFTTCISRDKRTFYIQSSGLYCRVSRASIERRLRRALFAKECMTLLWSLNQVPQSNPLTMGGCKSCLRTSSRTASSTVRLVQNRRPFGNSFSSNSSEDALAITANCCLLFLDRKWFAAIRDPVKVTCCPWSGSIKAFHSWKLKASTLLALWSSYHCFRAIAMVYPCHPRRAQICDSGLEVWDYV